MHKRITKDRCRYIASIVRGKSVLDVGCVDHTADSRKRGHWLHDFLRNSSDTIVGIDYEKDEIDKLREEGYNVIFADATDFHLNQTFDIIVAGEFIEHISNPGLFLQCAQEHLTKDGLLVLSTPNANCLTYFLENMLFGKEIENDDHVCIYSPKTLSALLAKNGFKAQRVTFVAENTSFFHDRLIMKFLVHIKQILQSCFCFFRPSLAQQVIIVASKS